MKKFQKIKSHCSNFYKNLTPFPTKPITIKITSPSEKSKQIELTDSPKCESNPCETSTSKITENVPIIKTSDEFLITPFAQILGCLSKTILNFDNFKQIAGNNDDKENIHKMADEISSNLNWCLKLLKEIHINHSLSDLTNKKFVRLLTEELSPIDNNQINDYIYANFLDTHMEFDSLSRLRRISKLSSIHEETKLKKLQKYKPKQKYLFGVPCSDEEKMIELMNDCCNWNFNILQLSELTNNRPLTSIFYQILRQENLINLLKLDEKKLISFISIIESLYNSKLPYHNNLHAADVTKSSYILSQMNPVKKCLSNLDLFSLIFAAAIHDVDHKGLSNSFLSKTNLEFAILYNDNSILENHHLATSFAYLQNEDLNFIKSFSISEKSKFRRTVIDIVLATDMSKHMNLLSEMTTFLETKVEKNSEISLTKYNEKIIVLKNLVHCADLGNPTMELPVYQHWVKAIMAELFSQGDIEKSLGMTTSPMCDRETASIEMNQISFINVIVIPIWDIWSQLVHPHADFIMKQINVNKEYYQSIIDVENKN
ncbi:hypothetical protein A3Q56_00851 [Intoshia linei]|uniref:Phosphodiesterase n=1 Tax=Intoshia linei TaxID=1819745 RepID=A0A177BAN4_9BILA|nr:hypothetical protein A3Q56_00851 [Intoshia linei]